MTDARQEAIVGDWDGSKARAQDGAIEQLGDLQRQVRSAYLDVVDHRDRASQDPTAAGRIRAVAYQTCASRLLRVLDTQRSEPAELDPDPGSLWILTQDAAPAEETSATCAGCGLPLGMVNGLSSCDTTGCGGNLHLSDSGERTEASVATGPRPLGWLFNKGVRANG